MFRRAAPALVLAFAVSSLTAHLSQATSPDEGAIGPSAASTSWEGGGFVASRRLPGEPGCLGPADPLCDHFRLTVEAAAPTGGSVVVELVPTDARDDLDIHVFDDGGQRVGGANTYDPERGEERAVMAGLPAGQYTVSVQPYDLESDGTYRATARYASEAESTQFISFSGAVREGVIHSCLEPVPHPVSELTGSDGTDVVIDVLVLLDGISEQRATAVVAAARPAYDEIGLVVSATFDTSFVASSTGMGNEMGGEPRPQADPDTMLDEARAHVGGARPDGIDAVIVMTHQDLDGIAGRADCIGGIHRPETGFAVAEAWLDDDPRLLATQRQFSAVVFAHELGHVLGAHHHYGSCARGAGTPVGPGGQDEQCSLMLYLTAGGRRFSDSALHFSHLNAAVVRSHAIDHAEQQVETAFDLRDLRGQRARP